MTRRTSTRWGAVVPLALAFAAACGGRSETTPIDEGCLASGACVCRTATDCPAALSCIDGRCQSPEAVTGTREFGSLCDRDVECGSGRCIAAGDGSYGRCTQSCEDTCPDGWACRTDAINPSQGLCYEDQFRLCAACTGPEDCGAGGSGQCSNGVCTADCARTPCPDGYACVEVAPGASQCVAASACGCGPGAGGRAEACRQSNEFGTCWGEVRCGASSCDAPTPRAEVCNGVDDDCDGLVDADDPSVAIGDLPVDPAYPACQIGDADGCRGEWRCDGAGWICEPAAPMSESCDGLDNDCDGLIDQPFVNDAGVYLTTAHCGGCNRDCGTIVADLRTLDDGSVDPNAITCALRAGAPTCIPLACRPGYAPYPEDTPVTCVPVPSIQCLSCVDSSDCLFGANRCVQLAEDLEPSCLQGCGPDAPAPGCTGEVGAQGCCPQGSTCRSRDGALICVPDGPGCDCTSERIGVTRPCRRPGFGGTCAGLETCVPGPNGPAWSACDATDVTREVCNGLDDDCDGVADDSFINTQASGTYDTAAHCGQCFQSCLALPQAIGRCAVDAGAPACAIDTCLPGRVAGGGFCRTDNDCTGNLACDGTLFQCVRRCGAGCAANQTCVDGFCAPRCTRDADCPGAESTCRDGLCAVDYTYVDLDEAVSNGCECPFAGSANEDAPDVFAQYPDAGAKFLDRNCDGVDGVASASLFVRAGAAAGDGTRERPFSSIGQALAVADSRRDTILVAGGLYAETVVVTRNVALFGGYSADFGERDIVGRPSIIAPSRPIGGNAPSAALTVSGRITATVAGFVVRAWDGSGGVRASEDGSNSVAVLLDGAGPQVVLQNNELIAGRGGDGAPGDAGQSGDGGGDGGDGRNARECGSTRCGGEVMNGGAAGRNTACPSAAGIVGGRSSGAADPQQYQAPLGRNGRGGDNATYSSFNNPEFANLCKYDCFVPGDQVGQPAQSGANGRDGSGGGGCTSSIGRLVGSAWRAAAATSGTAGFAGQGGGGGGAGGNVVNDNPSTCTIGNRVGDLGSTGGGGGAGGCGGLGGGRGGGGGASVAVLVVNSSGSGPSIVGNQIVRGQGGDGGRGGAGGGGGTGGQGGNGGTAGPPAWCAGDAGKGGRGGDGGGGGGGGGGCGGASYGVAGVGFDVVRVANENAFNTILGGSGGRGGLGGSTPGAGAGTAGLQGDSNVVQRF